MAVIFRGIAFPFGKNGVTFPAPATDADLIKQDLTRLIMQARGERVMRRDVGSLALGYIFENSDVALDNQIRVDLTSVISRYEPRIVVQNIGITRNETQVIILVEFLVLSTNQLQSLSVVLGSP